MRSCRPRRGRGAARRGRRPAGQAAGRAERRVVQAPDLQEDQEHRDHEPEVADARGDERLLARDRGTPALEPERDQQVRAEADALPAEERDEEARAEHQDQHRGAEQVHVREEARKALVAVHVADREDMDERSDAGDEEDERHRERVDEEAHVDLEPARRQPFEERGHVGAFGLGQREQRGEGDDRPQERAGHQTRSRPSRPRLTHARAEDQEHRRAEQRQQRHEPDEVEQVAFHQSRISRGGPGGRRRWRRDGAGRWPR